MTGLYDTNVAFGNGGAANIYTAFRGLIQDSPCPAQSWSLLFSVLSRAARIVNRAQDSAEWLVALSAFYALLFWSPIVSLSIYNGLIISWVAATVVLVYCGRHEIKPHRQALHSGEAGSAAQ